MTLFCKDWLLQQHNVCFIIRPWRLAGQSDCDGQPAKNDPQDIAENSHDLPLSDSGRCLACPASLFCQTS